MSEPTPKTPRHGAPQPPPLRELPWQARINASTLSLLGFIILALASLGVLGGSGRSLDTWGNLTRFIGRFFPPDLSVVDDALAAIGETVQIATMATLFSIVLSLPLAAAGYHVVAPDHRGYGRSGGADVKFDDSLWPFRPMERVRDTLGLVYALGYREVAMIVGQDFGASVAAWSTLIRPDVFRSMVLLSAPFPGPPPLPFDTAGKGAPPPPAGPDIHQAMAALPRPRKHYHW